MGQIKFTPKVKDKIGNLTIESEVFSERAKNGVVRRFVWVRCDCDYWHLFRIRVTSLYGKSITKSCGCLNKSDNLRIQRNKRKIKTYDGKYYNKLRNTWYRMKRRCTNPRDTGYKDYGGRGIKVCQRWLGSFEAFSADMGDPPSKKHSIGRIDNNGDYCPENCRWELPKDQANNTRRSIFVTIYDERKTIKQWSEDERCKVCYNTLKARILIQKMDPELALTTEESFKEIEIEAFGEVKSLTNWTLDERCSVSVSTLHARLKRGWDNEKAISKPSDKLLTGFGETKSIKDWVDDDRCVVDRRTFVARLHDGWSVERALTEPKRDW